VRAIVRSAYGTPDILRLEEVPTPLPSEGEVLVRIRAASLNRADLDYLTGTPAITRAVMGIRRPKVDRVGLDAAGEVEATGPGVTRFKDGDRVYADLTPHGQGAFAEFACAPEKAWHRIPAGLEFDAASAVPQSAILALEGLGGRDGVKPGDRVLINGASGCVGPFAVQMAKAAGAEVTGVCRTSKMDFVRSLGADHVIDYTRDDYTRNGQRYNRIVDTAGNRSVFAVRRALAPNGVYQSYGGPSTVRIFQTLVLGPLSSLFSSRKAGLMTAWKPNDPAEMAILGEMLEAGTLVPVIDRHYPLSEVPDALRYLAAGKAQGKLVITM
jgi:NADPH:quinone reductase-like Zn-dependent oxidoreductase